jgi:hypothetical protein
MIGNQLDGKKGKRSAGFSAFKSADGHQLFAVPIDLDGVAPVGFSLRVAVETSAYRTDWVKIGEKIDLLRKIRFFIFPNIVESVIEGYLYFFLKEGCLGANRCILLFSLVVFLRLIPYLAI